MTRQQYTAEQSSSSTQVDAQPQTFTNAQREEMGQDFSRQTSLDVLIDLALVLCKATGAALALAECGEMVCLAASGTLAPDVGQHIDPRSGLLGLCLRTTEVVLSENIDMDARVDRAAAGGLNARSAIAVPLCSGGTTIGVLEAVSSEFSAFNDRAVRNLKGLADLIAHASLSHRTSHCSSVVEMKPRQIAGIPSTEAPAPGSSVRGEDHAALALTGAPARTGLARLSVPKLFLATALSSFVLTSSGLFLLTQGDTKRPNELSTTRRSALLQAGRSKLTEIPQLVSNDDAKTGGSFMPSQKSGRPQVMRIAVTSGARFTEVTVTLSTAVPYDAHRFGNPERIYFDFHSTDLAPGLGPWGKTFEVGDRFLVDVRVAQHAVGLTRVVLDTTGVLQWSKTLAGNPPRLIIRVGNRKQDLERHLAADRWRQISWNTTSPGRALDNEKSTADNNSKRATLRSSELAHAAREPSPAPRRSALRAIYLTGLTAGSPRGLQLIENWRRMDGNAIVFDIKDDSGVVNVPFEHPLNYPSVRPAIEDLPKFVAYLHSTGIYAIGRISVFRDQRLITEHPELAVRSRRDGRPWSEKGKTVWADPSRREVQQYNIALAKAAAAARLDEVQFDYVRFPVQGNQRDAVFDIDSKKVKWRRSDVITHFVAEAYSQLHPRHVRLSLDVFGVLAWDRGVDIAHTGQDVRALLHFCDVISPMIYPSHFFGMDGYIHPGDAPQHFICEAMKRFLTITASTGVLVRPWLQGFSWHTKTYSTQYVLTQIDAVRANGGTGFLFWNAENEYDAPLAALSQMRSSEIDHQVK